MARIGIIGGSGLDNPDLLETIDRLVVDTRFGSPSSPFVVGKMAGHELFILARHGTDHSIPPSEVNYRGNIAAFEGVGVDCILATTATGSLRQEIGRGDILFPDQFIDHTVRRMNTFFSQFDSSAPQHTPMADPFDEGLRCQFMAAAEKLSIPFHKTGTVITIEGPRFSTRAESRMFQSWGADVINMSVATECALANEAKIPYGVIAMATDYDCWKLDEKPVSHSDVLAIFQANVEKVTSILMQTIRDYKDS